MFAGDFQEARAAAKADKKLLLVNIQSESEFKCHELNRDLWKVQKAMHNQLLNTAHKPSPLSTSIISMMACSVAFDL
jgi:Thioredoxin-like